RVRRGAAADPPVRTGAGWARGRPSSRDNRHEPGPRNGDGRRRPADGSSPHPRRGSRVGQETFAAEMMPKLGGNVRPEHAHVILNFTQRTASDEDGSDRWMAERELDRCRSQRYAVKAAD